MSARHRTSPRRLAALAAVAATGILLSAPPARAACHAFTVEVDPATVTEGAEVTVTVSRDAGVGPSQIDVETVDGTATGGADYEAVARRTVSFSSETSQSFTVPTVDDPDAEPSETFALHLSNPGGCAVNPNFVIGPDATVTITDNDASSATAAPTSTSTAARPSTTAPDDAEESSTTSTSDPAGSSTSTTAPRTSTSVTAGGVASSVSDDDDDDGGVPAGAVVAALVVVLAAGAGAAWAWRRRSRIT